MKKLLLLFTLSLSANLCFSQIDVTKSEFPSYQGVVDISGTPKAESYPKIKAWVATNFASANDVIQIDDKDNGKMIVKGNTIIPVKSVGMIVDTRVHFSLAIDVKDDRFRYTYEVSDITSGTTSRFQMRDMNRNNKIVAQLKEDIAAAFKNYVLNLRSSILDTNSDDW